MKLKKAISGILATAVLASSMLTAVQPALAWDAPSNDWQLATEDVAARFFVGSDTHIDRTDASKKLTNALDAFYQVDPKADGVLLVGDVTNNGYDSEYSTLMNVVNSSDFGEAGKVEIAMGNHEYNTNASTAKSRFEEKTGQDANEVLYYDNNGKATSEPGETLAATVIKLSAKNYGGDYTDQYDMVKTALETATATNDKAPILVMGHHGIPNTAYVTDEWNGNYGSMLDLFKQYPQVIHFSGHSHATLEDARSIYQDDGYTAIQDGTIGAYFENEKGKVDPTSGASATRPADSEIASQALRVDILDDGTVKIYRMNLTTGEYMYEPWTFNVDPNSENLPYTNDREGTAPSFDADAAVTADSIGEKEATVHFPTAQAASGDNNDMVHEYVITLTPQGGGSAITCRFFADYYMPADQQKENWSVKLTGLASGTSYDVSVTAETSFGNASDAITGTLTTEAEKPYVTPQPDVLNIDFRSDSTADANGHNLKEVGSPTKVTDATYGTVYRFDGKDDGFGYAMSDEDYNKFKNGYTMEVMLKSNGTTGDEQDFFSNQQSAGCGFALNKDGKTLEFWNNVTSGKAMPTTDVSTIKNDWMHLVATFDGENTKLYVNGELKSTEESAGSLKIPSPHYFYVGGDSRSDGNLEFPANCDIALARLYSGAMNATDVAKTYESVVIDDSYQTPEADVLNIDFRSDNGTDDANGHDLKKVGEPTKVTDPTYGTVYRFDGTDDGFGYALSAEDYNKFKNGYTMEVMVKSTGTTGDEQDFFSNQQSAGCGFALNKDGKTLEFWNNTTSDKVKPSSDISSIKGQWMHLVATFDGKTTKLYVNGELKDSVKGAGSLTIPSPHIFYLGGDSNSDGNLEFPANCDIALARLYSGAMNTTDVGKAYEKATTPVAPQSYTVTVADTENGTATVDKETAKAGETVKITTAPSDGYKVENVTVSKASGGNVDVTDNKDGSYSFTQPAEDVTVNVSFVKCYTPDIPEVTGGEVTLDPAQPAVGDDVTITAAPDDGYEVDHIQLTVTNEKLEGSDAQTLSLDDLQPGENVSLKADEQGQYHFKQPAYKVEIEPVFAKEDSGSGGGGVAHYVPEITHNDGGSVKVNPSAPAAGQTVTITAAPDDGFVVDTVSVTDKNGEAVATTKNSDGTFSFEQPHGKVSITVTFAKAGSEWNNPFSDVNEEDWFFDPVRYVQQNGLMVGTSDDAFSPNLSTSRGMLVTILWRLAGEPAADQSANFSDVAADSWYADAVAWASGEGIVGGYGDGRFGANDAITREQMASMFQRYADFCGIDTSARGDLSAFSDGDTVSSWANEPMAWAIADGLLGGFEDNSLRPQGQATRAQVAAILQRFSK